MVSSRSLLVLGALVTFATAQAPEIGKRAPFEAVGIEKNQDGFGSEPVVDDEDFAQWAPPTQLGEKNATIPQLKDRSLDLMERQTCNTGYWYCPYFMWANNVEAFGKCCPTTSNCCSYGYCINPSNTCCPNGPCDPGWNCCGSNCSPKGGDCCSDGHYCEAGNICVKLGSTGQIVCCTDLKCTAAVVSGTTKYASSTVNSPPPTSTPIVSTPKPSTPISTPATTPISTPATTRATTAAPSSVVITYETWYWTVTWWYLSFYWSTQQQQSTVTYTRVYTTTTFTTTATDVTQASSLFKSLSSTLTFTPPASAQTSLASLLNAPLTQTAVTADNSFGLGTTSPTSASSSTSSSRTSSATTTATNTAFNGPSTPKTNMMNGMGVPICLMAAAGLSGILMLWL